MRFHKIFLHALVFTSTLVPVLAEETPQVRLGDEVRPVFQAIHLKLDPAEPRYRGAVRIELEVDRETDHFRFHSEGHELTRVVLEQAGGGAVAIRWEPEGDDVLHVRTQEPLAADGRYVLEVAFTSAFNDDAVALYRLEHEGRAYAFTQFAPDEAREAFPCWDEPAFKHPFRMTLEVPEGHLAVTNTAVEEERLEGGWRTFVFRRTRPLPTYLLAIASGRFESVPMAGLSVPGRVLTLPGQGELAAAAVAATPPLLAAMEAYFGSPYPYAKLDFVAVPEFLLGAMEHPGAVTFASRFLLLDPATASTTERQEMAWMIAHELAHMWFGNLVTMRWWNDLWLNEAFADWLSFKIAHRVSPELGVDVLGVDRGQDVMRLDAQPTSPAIRRPVPSSKGAYDYDGLWLAYQKGARVLSMVERWLGAEVFRRGVLAYLENHAWGHATAADLWRALDETAGAKQVSAVLASFLDQPGFPLVDVELLEDGRLKLSQRRFTSYGVTAPPLAWKLPVTLKLGHDGGVEERTVFLDRPTRIESLTAADGRPLRPQWIFANAGGGYYRWTVPGDKLLALAQDAGQILTPTERIDLIGNASALLEAGAIGGDVYLGTLAAMAGDPDPIVVSSMLSSLDPVWTSLVPSGLREAFAAWVRQALGPALGRIGVDKTAGEAEAASLLRPKLYRWLGREGGDAQVRARAGEIAAAFLKGSAPGDPSLLNVALNLAAHGGDRRLFEAYRSRFEAAQNAADRQRFLFALASFGSADLHQAALDYFAAGPLRPEELLSLMTESSLLHDASRRDRFYRWVADNYAAIAARLPEPAVPYLPLAANGCSRERLAAAEAFFRQDEHNVPGTDRLLTRVASQVGNCLQLRERTGEAVKSYLEAFSG